MVPVWYVLPKSFLLRFDGVYGMVAKPLVAAIPISDARSTHSLLICFKNPEPNWNSWVNIPYFTKSSNLSGLFLCCPTCYAAKSYVFLLSVKSLVLAQKLLTFLLFLPLSLSHSLSLSRHKHSLSVSLGFAWGVSHFWCLFFPLP